MFGRHHAKTRQELVRAEFSQSLGHFRRAAVHAAGGVGATVGPRPGRGKGKNGSPMSFMAPAAKRIGGMTSRGWDQTIAAFAPLAESARQGAERAAKLDAKNGAAKQGKKGNGDKANGKSMTRIGITSVTEERTSSHTGLYVLLATGAAVGAAGALVARRRTRAKWAEYEPNSLSEDASSFMGAGAVSTKTFGGKPGEGGEAGSPVGKAATWTKESAKSAVDSLRGKIHDATAARDSGGNGASAAATAPAASGEGEGGPRAVDDEVDELIRSAKEGRS